MNLLLFGAPGAGKGTQSEILVEKKGFKHISTGDLFREAMKNNTPIGLEAKKYMNDGNLVPDSITISLIEELFNKLGDKSFILDGFPRTVAQAEALETLTKSKKINIKHAVFLDAPESLLLRRLTGRRVCGKCGAVYHVDNKMPKKDGACDKCDGQVIQRKDDSEEVIKNRLQTYEKSTAPLKAFYEKKGILMKLDGSGNATDVYSRLEKAIF